MAACVHLASRITVLDCLCKAPRLARSVLPALAFPKLGQPERKPLHGTRRVVPSARAEARGCVCAMGEAAIYATVVGSETYVSFRNVLEIMRAAVSSCNLSDFSCES